MQQTTTIEVSMNNCFNHFNNNNDGEQRMTSLEIAELTGKQHKDVLKAIRTMEPAWVKVQGRNFSLLQKTYNLPNGGTKMMPYYSLTKTECLYIATKFNDEARARLVLRWEELERERLTAREVRMLPEPKKILAMADCIISKAGEGLQRRAAGHGHPVPVPRTVEHRRRPRGAGTDIDAHARLVLAEGGEEGEALHDVDHRRTALPECEAGVPEFLKDRVMF